MSILNSSSRRRYMGSLQNGLRGVPLALAFAAIGFFGLRASHAASFAVAREAEAGVVSGNTVPGDTAGASSGAAVKFQASVTPPSPGAFEVGLVANSDIANEIPRVASVGGKVIRYEFSPNDDPSKLQALVDLANSKGIRLQPLAGWNNGVTPPDLTNVAQWAKVYGPGGTHWAGKSDANAITDIELGNENSFSYKSGDTGSSTYQNIALAYGQKALAAAKAVKAANPNVGVLVEMDDGNTGSANWINKVIDGGGAELISLMHGPTIHPYGPGFMDRINRNFAAMSARGLTKPYYMTEWGISTDDGRTLSDNYGFPKNMTYNTAATTLTTSVNSMKSSGKVHQLIYYQTSDQRDPGADTDRERYFGIFQLGGAAKGNLKSAMQTLCGMYP